MQRVDLTVDGRLVNKAQKSDSPAFQKRVTTAYQTHARVVVSRSKPAPVPSPIPPAPVPTPGWSIFSGRGLFTTTNVESAGGLHADWTAIQKDPEGDHREGVPGHLCFWLARPAPAVRDEAIERGIPLIVQSEGPGEFASALNLWIPELARIPHGLIGKVDHTWDATQRALAVAHQWDLLLEWYWVNEPSYTEPNADGYPLFRNVVFGTFNSETVPGRRVSVCKSRSVWGGSFSCWDTEGMDGEDRACFNQ